MDIEKRKKELMDKYMSNELEPLDLVYKIMDLEMTIERYEDAIENRNVCDNCNSNIRRSMSEGSING